jgi:hypothetical protein
MLARNMIPTSLKRGKDAIEQRSKKTSSPNVSSKSKFTKNIIFMAHKDVLSTKSSYKVIKSSSLSTPYQEAGSGLANDGGLVKVTYNK